MSPTIGEQLKEARQARKLTLKKVMQATAIRTYYLEAMEADEFESLPSPVQARGFLRSYANFLGLDADKLIATLRGEPTPVPLVELPKPTPESDSPQPAAVTEAEPEPQEQTPTPPEPEPETPAIKESIIFPSLPYAPYEDEEAEEPAFGDLPSEDLQPLSKSMMIEIGEQLKGRRELLSLTLDEIERHTHIRKRHLQALEDGAFEDLPSTVQARGMLTSYARFLDMDVDAMMLRFADTLQAWRNERHPRSPRQRTSAVEQRSGFMFWLRQLLSTDLVFGGGLIVAMVIFAIWGAGRIILLQQEKEAGQDTSQSISEALLAITPEELLATAAPTPTIDLLAPTVIGEAITPTAIEILAPQSEAPVQVIVVTTQRTWVRVTVDGKVEFEGRAQAGSALTYEGDERIEVLTADGGAVQIIYNQQQMGTMGNPGQVANLIYTPTEVLEPTPTITPSPTRTPRTTPTRIPSRTPTPGDSTIPGG